MPKWTTGVPYFSACPHYVMRTMPPPCELSVFSFHCWSLDTGRPKCPRNMCSLCFTGILAKMKSLGTRAFNTSETGLWTHKVLWWVTDSESKGDHFCLVPLVPRPMIPSTGAQRCILSDALPSWQSNASDPTYWLCLQLAASRWCFVTPVGHIIVGCLPHLRCIEAPLVRCHLVWDSMTGDQTLCMSLEEEC